MTEKTEHSERTFEHKGENSAERAHAALLHEAMDSGIKSAATAATTSKGDNTSGDTYVPPVQISENPFPQADINRVTDLLAYARFGTPLPENDGVTSLTTGDYMVKDGDKLSIFTKSGDKFTVNPDGTFTTKGNVESANPNGSSRTPHYRIELGDGTKIDYDPGVSLSITKGLHSDTFSMLKRSAVKNVPGGWLIDLDSDKHNDVKPFDQSIHQLH